MMNHLIRLDASNDRDSLLSVIEDMFDYYYGNELREDATPPEVRERIRSLNTMYSIAQRERSLCQNWDNGKKYIGIYNNIIAMLNMAIKTTESISMSLMNELRRLE